MKISIVFFILFMNCFDSVAQKFTIEKSIVTFYSHAAIEDITANNRKAAGIFNTATSDIAFSIPVNEFQFAKSLMQEHFNEKYMESEKFPKSTFQGKVSGFDASIDGPQQANARGKLNIHGVTHDVDLPGTIENQGDKLFVKAKFIVKLEDFKIIIPQLLWQKIAEQVEVSVEFTFKPQ
jgi:polyisoprenoid-binding protein YceI